jgi:hypothetical protein
MDSNVDPDFSCRGSHHVRQTGERIDKGCSQEETMSGSVRH